MDGTKNERDPFAPRAAAIRKRASVEAREQRKRELRFKAFVSDRKLQPLASVTHDELLTEVVAWHKIADTVSGTAKIWRKLYRQAQRQLRAADKKIARLEKELAHVRPS